MPKHTEAEWERIADLLEELTECEKYAKELKADLRHLEEAMQENAVKMHFIRRSLERNGYEIDHG